MKKERASAGAQTAAPHLQLIPSRHFVAWLEAQQAGIAFTTYQTGKLFLVGSAGDGRLSVFERSFSRCMGLCAAGDTLYLGSLYQLWRLENTLAAGETHEGFDRLYVPRVGYTTGDVDAHDLALDARGRLLFVNTLFSCLATVSERFSFVPLWKPPFVSRLAAEDRCHLNGLALRDGAPAFVTAVSRSDVADGWRDQRADGGVVIDVASGEIVLDGLSMPHSPRWHGGRLWLLDSGNGTLGWVDFGRRRLQAVAFCPGYLRGLAFHGTHAVVGVSLPRTSHSFSGLPLEGKLRARGAEPRCALHVIDLRSGDTVHWLRVEGVVQELYDVALLPGARRPMALGFRSDEIRRVFAVGPPPGPPEFS